MNLKGYLLFLFIFIIIWQSFAQDSFYVIGRIKDSQTQQIISTAHVVNLKSKKGSISNREGHFMIQVNEGDYLKFSFLGYNNLYHQVKSETKDTIDIALIKKTYELSEVDIFPWTKDEFKYEFVHGEFKKDSIDWLKDRINLSKEELRWLTPSRFTINYKTKKERQEVKLIEIKKWVEREEAFRKSVIRMTDYEGLELEVFIRFCNFSKQFISNAREYYLTSALRGKYLEFEKLKEAKQQ